MVSSMATWIGSPLWTDAILGKCVSIGNHCFKGQLVHCNTEPGDCVRDNAEHHITFCLFVHAVLVCIMVSSPALRWGVL